MEPASQITSILQASIAPVSMISGIGLLLLSMSNRYGRAIDRARILSATHDKMDEAHRCSCQKQIRMLYERCHILRGVITLASSSIFLVSLTILFLFLTHYFKMPLGSYIAASFVGSMVCLVASMVLFIKDISISLKALKEELDSFIK